MAAKLRKEGRIPLGAVKPTNEREEIWIYDVDRGTRVSLVTDQSWGELYSPEWSPDGKQIAYRSLAGKKATLLINASDGSGKEKSGFQADLITGTDWSPDGRYIATNHPDETRLSDLRNGRCAAPL